MKWIQFIFIGLFLLLPFHAEAKITEKWRFHTSEDVDLWRSGGFDEAQLIDDALVFNIEEQGALYRPLPEGFHKNIDAIRVYLDAETMEGIELVFLLSEGSEILKRFRLSMHVYEVGDDGEAYIPLGIYRKHIRGTETLALRFEGEHKDVRFQGIDFYDHSLVDKIIGSWRSFWMLESLVPSSINLIVGPVIAPDLGRDGTLNEEFSFYRSWNAYLYVLIAVFGFALLFWGVYQTQERGRQWRDVQRQILPSFFIFVAVIWIAYDLRMGLEYFHGVYEDHQQFISQPKETRTFRDLDRFYDFALFAEKLVADRKEYELMLPTTWPYLGHIRYITYPSIANNQIDPISDTWVVYDRPDVSVSADGKLMHEGETFSKEGRVLGWFDEGSFVFRENP